MIWVTSGATEIGRLDYIKRTGCELSRDPEQDKADYASQGQSILMQNYRQFVPPEYGIRQILVEHTHFNDPEKSEHIRQLLVRAARQKTIPIVNYNDPVSDEENRKMELAARREKGGEVHECVDNDETAAVIAGLVKAKTLVLMTSTEGIYQDRNNPETLVCDVIGKTYEEVEQKVAEGLAQYVSQQAIIADLIEQRKARRLPDGRFIEVYRRFDPRPKLDFGPYKRLLAKLL